MRALVIDDEARAKVDRVLKFATRQENWYRLDVDVLAVPGNDYRYCTKLDSYRCVFTITARRDGSLFRHLSISVPSDKYANPIAAWTIAELFGFTGWDGKSDMLPAGWLGRVNEKEHCIVIVQPVTEAELAA